MNRVDSMSRGMTDAKPLEAFAAEHPLRQPDAPAS